MTTSGARSPVDGFYENTVRSEGYVGIDTY